jgi:hypothetical protein
MPNSSALVLRDYIKHFENSHKVYSYLYCHVLSGYPVYPLCAPSHVVETKQPKQDTVSKSQRFPYGCNFKMLKRSEAYKAI